MGCVCLLTAQSRGFYCSIRWLPLISAGSWVPRDQDITGQDKVFLLEIVRREEEVGHRPPWTDPNCYRPTTKDEIKIEKITIKKYFVTAGSCNSFIGDLWNPSQRGNNFPNFQESNWEFRSSVWPLPVGNCWGKHFEILETIFTLPLFVHTASWHTIF